MSINEIPGSYTCLEGSTTFFHPSIIPYEANKVYTIDLDVKSVGEENSNIYVVVKCLRSTDANDFIPSRNAYYYSGTELTIKYVGKEELYVPSSEFDTLVKWKNASGVEHSRYIGFYFDGNINKQPDEVIEYSDINIVDGIIFSSKITDTLRAKINTTSVKACNHFLSSTWTYPFNGLIPISDGWKHLSMQISGQGLGTQTPIPFRYGTTHFQIGLLANFQQSNKVALGVRNFKISECIKVIL